MFKISHFHEMQQVSGIPEEVTALAESIVTILDREYGEKRDPQNSDGGYIIILEPQDDISILNNLGFNVGNLYPEHTDIMKTSSGIDYIHIFILFTNEYSVQIFMPKEKATANLLEV